MNFDISKRARRQIERIQAFWVKNRPKAPALFLDELAKAEALLRAQPEIGTVYAVKNNGVVRSVVLSGTGHRVYYRYRRDRDQLTVLSVWGMPRERGPKL